MKNLKKVLALVMAFAMAFTMMASAAYTDSADIKATEAVDTLTALGVMSGDPNGSFRPNDTITRAEACRIIYTIRSGGNSDASAYAGMQTTFKDVPATAWYAGYVKHCQSVGIVSGKSATVFDPNAPVTGVELALMSLRVMGYDPAKADIGGSTWSMKTIGLATEAGILDGVDTAIQSAAPRQYAAQIMYNMIDANTVRWSEDAKEYVNTNMLNTAKNPTVGNKYMNLDTYEGVLKASGKYNAMAASNTGSDKIVVDVDTVNGNSQVIADKDFKFAKDATQHLGQYVKVMYDTKKKVAYGVTPVAGENTVIESTVGKVDSVAVGATKVKVDGTEYDLDFTVAGGDTNAYFAQGTSADDFATVFAGQKTASKVKFISNDGNGKIDLAIVVPVTAQQVTYAGSDNTTYKGLNSAAALGNVKNADAIIEGTLAKDAYVAVVDKAYNFDGKYEVSKLDVFEGKVSQIKGTTVAPTDVKVDNNWYKLYNATGTAVKDTDGNVVAVDNTYKFVAIGGYVYNAEMVTGSATKMALITGITSNVDFDSYAQARMMLTDGTEVTAYMAEVEAGGANKMSGVTAGNLVAYEKDGDRYKIYLAGKSYSDSKNTAKALAGYTTSVGITNGGVATGLSPAYDESAKTLNGRKVNDSAVVFLISNKSATDATKVYKVVSGKDLNSWKSDWGTIGGGMYKTSGLGYLDVAVVGDTTYSATPGATTNYGYITSDPSIGSDAISFMLWDGASEKSIEVTEKVSSNGAIVKGNVVSFDWDGESVVKNVVSVGTIGAIEYTNGTQVKINGVGYDLAKDVAILNVDTADQKGVPGKAIAEAQKDASGVVYSNAYYVLNSDGDIEMLVVDVKSNKWAGATKAVVNSTTATAAEITAAFAAVGASGTVTVTGTLPASGVSVGATQTLVVSSAQTTAALEAITAVAGAKLVVGATSTTTNVAADTWFAGTAGSATADSAVKVVAATYTYTTNADGSSNNGWLRA